MSEKIYLNLLILCGILSQGILGTFLEDNYKVSSKLLSRKKRVTDNTFLGSSRRYSITQISYIVKVLHNEVKICTGIIVSPGLILTAKICAEKSAATYSVESGEINNGVSDVHIVINIITEGDLALLLIHPPIVESPLGNRRIELFEDKVGTRTIATVAGWALIGTEIKRRATTIPILGQKKCSDYFQDQIRYALTSDNLCTFEPTGEKGCTHEDGGSALVLNRDQLIGVLIFAGADLPDGPRPDVFIRVNNGNPYNKWIKTQIRAYLHKVNDPQQYAHMMHLHTQNLHFLQAINQHSYNQHATNQHPTNHQTNNQYLQAHTSNPFPQPQTLYNQDPRNPSSNAQTSNNTQPLHYLDVLNYLEPLNKFVHPHPGHYSHYPQYLQ